MHKLFTIMCKHYDRFSTYEYNVEWESVIWENWVQMRYIQIKRRSWPVSYWGQHASRTEIIQLLKDPIPKSIGQWDGESTATVLQCPACVQLMHMFDSEQKVTSWCCCKTGMINIEIMYNWCYLSFMTLRPSRGWMCIHRNTFLFVFFLKLWV